MHLSIGIVVWTAIGAIGALALVAVTIWLTITGRRRDDRKRQEERQRDDRRREEERQRDDRMRAEDRKRDDRLREEARQETERRELVP